MTDVVASIYGTHKARAAAESARKATPNIRLGIDNLAAELWQTAIKRAEGAMEARKIKDRESGIMPIDHSKAYTVTPQYVARAYRELIEEQALEIMAALQAHKGIYQPKFQADSMEGLLLAGTPDPYASL